MFRLVLFYTISFPYYSNRCFTDEVQSSHILTPSPTIIHHAWPFIPHLYLHLYSHPPSPIPLTLPSPLTFTLTLEPPINRAFQPKSEGVRVRKEKKYFYYIAIWMGRIHRQRLWDIPIIAENYTGQNVTTNIWRELWETRWRGQKKRQESKN